VICSSHTAPRLLLLATFALPILFVPPARGALASSFPPARPTAARSALPSVRPDPPDRAIFARASARSGVPVMVLLALSYVQSSWNGHPGVRSVDGGYGLMDLVRTTDRDTLGAAAHLLRVSPALLTRDDALNVLGGALLLASTARGLSPAHALPPALTAWSAAIVLFTGMRTRLAAGIMLRDVYGTLARGVVVRGPHRTLALAPTPGAHPDPRALDHLRLHANTSSWSMVAAPAVSLSVAGFWERGLPASPYAANGAVRTPAASPARRPIAPRLQRTGSPAPATASTPSTVARPYTRTQGGIAPRDASVDYPGAVWAPSPNYTAAGRPADLGVRYAVIHDTEGGCAASLNWLLNPQSGGSAHFLVCQDGTIYQLVHVRDVAWHAGNWYVNQHSIGIEHEGYRDSGGYTTAQYDASADLLRSLNTSFGLTIAADRNSILGHENVPSATHTDPGPLWDWGYYLGRVRNGPPRDGGDPSVAAVVTGQTTLYSCPAASCTVMGTANWGEQFAVAAASNGWDEVYYNGAAAWLDAGGVASGAGTRLRVTASTLNVRDEPSMDGAIIGSAPGGQVYVSRLLDTSLDAAGWWLIPFNHRYGFINSRYVSSVTGPLPAPGTPAPTPAAPPSATPSPAAALPSMTLTTRTPITPPTLAPPVTPVATAVMVVTPAATPTTATLTALAQSPAPSAQWPPVMTSVATPPTLTATITATLPLSATPTATITPASTALPSPTATATVAPSATSVPTATRWPAPHPRVAAPARVPRKPSRTTTRPVPLAVALAPAHVRVSSRLVLRVHTAAGHATVRYRLDLPGGLTLRAQGRTDARGNGTQAFTVPGSRQLHALLARAARQHRTIKRSGLPRWVDAHYIVTASWPRHIIVRGGTFRISY